MLRSLRSIRHLLAAAPLASLAACGIGGEAGPGPVAAAPTIVFDADSGGNRDLWAVALEGGVRRRLTTNAAEDLDPSPGPKGMVAFVSYRFGNAELLVRDAAGGERRVTSTSAQETEPALSPDGLTIAHVSTATGVGKLRLVALDGTNARDATANFGGAGTVDASPAWSPDGARIAFTSTASGGVTLHEVTVATRAVRALPVGSGNAVEPAWSPDGRRILFASTRDGGDTEIYLHTLADGTSRRLTNRAGIDASPAWIDDRRVAWLAHTGTTVALRWMAVDEPARSFEVPVGGLRPMRPTVAR